MTLGARRSWAWMALLLVVLSGCYGPFNLTRRLYQWNGQVNGKWEREFVFILLAWAPVYSLAVLGDAIVFNSMEFWTGNNPVDPPSGGKRGAVPQTKRVVRGEAKAVLTYLSTDEGGQLLVQQFQGGAPAGSLRLERRNGMAVGVDAEGRTLFSAQTLPDGQVMIHDGNDRLLALYGSEQADRLVRVTRASSAPSDKGAP